MQDEGLRLRKDGSRYWCNIVVATLQDASGNLIGFPQIVRDPTERKRSEDMVQYMAHYDALTELPNRYLLRMESCLWTAKGRSGVLTAASSSCGKSQTP